MQVRIGWLYPHSLSTYGDRGNVLALGQRARWRGLDVDIVEVHEDDDLPRDLDVLFMGGGQDSAQTRVGRSLAGGTGRRLRDLLDEGRAMLAICGGYQLLCNAYVTQQQDYVPGVGVFDAVTVAAEQRLVGNVRLTTRWGTVVGFENHSGRTYPAPGSEPLGRVLVGNGNNGEDGTEGLVAGSVVGSYLHGPLLPRNPALTDWLLEQGLRRRHHDLVLEPLSTELELATHPAGRLAR